MSTLDEKLDEILNRYGEYAVLKDVNQFDNVSMEREFPDLPNRAKAKQAIKQLIASELNDRMADHYAPELKTFDYDGIAESMIEWLGELQGGGDE